MSLGPVNSRPKPSPYSPLPLRISSQIPQKHHQAREVFLGVTECVEPAECIWGRAQVVRPDRLADTPGTDVYICEYEYDEKWKVRPGAWCKRPGGSKVAGCMLSCWE